MGMPIAHYNFPVQASVRWRSPWAFGTRQSSAFFCGSTSLTHTWYRCTTRHSGTTERHTLLLGSLRGFSGGCPLDASNLLNRGRDLRRGVARDTF
jgi:hypothetical protein